MPDTVTAERRFGARDDIARKWNGAADDVAAIEAAINQRGAHGVRWAAWQIFKLRGKEQRLLRRLQERASHAQAEMPAGGTI